MRMQGLSLETIPAIHIPFRFFYTAPLMGVAAGATLLFADDNALGSQWSPVLLAVTHLLTLGFMAMVMLGALFQLVPVISGQMIPGGAIVATAVHLLLLIGVALMAAGFMLQRYQWLALAGLSLLLAFATFLLPLASLLLRRIGGGDAIFTIRLAALSLLITVALGLIRSANFAGLAEPLPLANITNIHLGWGLGGWAVLLVMGASYQVIPMFHVTPSYPSWLSRTLPVIVVASLSALTLLPPHPFQAVAMLALCTSAIVYALFSIRLLGQRKRRVSDITARFWKLSLACLILAATLCLTIYFFGGQLPAAGLQQRMQVALGVLMIYGFATSVIMGMLQKIVPFLSYLHLQRRCLGNFEMLRTLPHMGLIIPALLSRWQFRLHFAALLILVMATLTGSGARLAALALMADFAWLAWTLFSAARIYYRTAVRVSIDDIDECAPSSL